MNRPFLKGDISITDNLEMVTDFAINPPQNLTIVNLDEFTEFQGNNVLGGVALLPPPEAVMAQVDGDEQSYNIIYENYFYNDNYINQFMVAILAYLYNGGSIIFYYPTLSTKETPIIATLLNMIWAKYGIGVGIIGENSVRYNESYLSYWVSLLYMNDIINCYTFLQEYPMNVNIDYSTMDKLILDLKPYSENQSNYIMNLIKLQKEKPQLKQAIYKLD